MSAGFDQQCAQLLAGWRAVLRATRILPEPDVERLLALLGDLLDNLAPIETLKLNPLLDALEQAGVDAGGREAALLLLHQRGDELGVPCELPHALVGMPPGERKRAIRRLAVHYYAELSEITADEEDDWRDRTPTINMKDLLVNDPVQRTATLQAIGGRYMGQLFRIPKETMSIGRGDDVDLLLDDEGVSRHHARIEALGDRHVLFDHGSKNGVVVNGFGVTEHLLDDGDRIQIGATTILRFAYHDQLEQDFQDKVLQSVSVDGPTGVYNRRFFLDQLRAECAWCGRQEDVPLSYLAIGVDDYRNLAEQRGHALRDQGLRTVADRLQETLRVEDILGRTGEGTFGLILRGIDRGGATVVAQRLQHLVEERPAAEGREPLLVTVSVGVASAEPGKTDVPDTLRRAAEGRLERAQAVGNHIVSKD